ncbi:hypothetical protein M406DRAFT_349617 [Cryphonectria parasitica EP155]|uniref:Uncharacterized protein n=1 Tax=Cryphonectria parasitica (strain ATCC 38755 / EP155) TaxID=660469 RepID=A0A9P5CVC5_CRYP1|nr:uncharacterized protein M406DRAFT_349617 [Cryphonectria parasitica EP155]KAF3771257.1 hypothetical protein M406DRAFT_349617 [Cryphonectria parasitica EP155]
MRFQVVVGAALLQLQGTLAAPASTASSDLDIQSILKNLNMTDDPLRACPLIARRGLKMKGCPTETIPTRIGTLLDEPVIDSTASSSSISKRCIYRRQDGNIDLGVCPAAVCEEGNICDIAKSKRCVMEREDGTDFEALCPAPLEEENQEEDECGPGESCKNKRGELNNKRCVWRRVDIEDPYLGVCSFPSCGLRSNETYCHEAMDIARDLQQQQDPARKKRSLEFPGVHISPVSGGVVNTYHGGSATVDKMARSSGLLSPFFECDAIARRGEELPKRCLHGGHGPVIFPMVDKTTVTDTAKRTTSSGLSSLWQNCLAIARRGDELPRRCIGENFPNPTKFWGANFPETAATAKRTVPSGLASLLNDCDTIARRGEELPKRCFLGVGPEIYEGPVQLEDKTTTAASKRTVPSGLASLLNDCDTIARRGEELPKRCAPWTTYQGPPLLPEEEIGTLKRGQEHHGEEKKRPHGNQDHTHAAKTQ